MIVETLKNINQRAISNSRQVLLVLLLTVFLTRLVIAGFILYPKNPEKALHADRWGSIALNIVDGNGYVYPYDDNDGTIERKPNAQRGPIPVYLLAGLFLVFGQNLWIVMLANWLCDIGVAYLLYRIARYVFKDDVRVAYVSILFWAFYIPEITITTKPFSEPIFTLLLAGFTLTMLQLQIRISTKMLVVSAILLAAATLSRPVTLAFPPIFCLILLLSKGINRDILEVHWLKKILKFSVVFTIVFCVGISPWVIRNYLVFEKFIPTSTLAGYNLIKDHYYLDSEDFLRELGSRRLLESSVERELHTRGETLRDKSEAERDLIYRGLAFEKIKAYPQRYIVVSGDRILRFFLSVTMREKPSLKQIAVMTLNAFLIFFAIISFFISHDNWLFRGFSIWVLIGYFMLTHIWIHANVQYCFPIIPYIIMFASNSIVSISILVRRQIVP
jgi:4-amino-4-deoxy-L-arabinose transferase-like glycosyltransferase